MEYDVQTTKSSAEKLADGINEFLKKEADAKVNHEKWAIRRSIRTYIEGFSVPSNKEDLIDFIIAMDERRKNRMFEDEYYSKWKEAMKKAKLLFPDDPQIASITADLSSKKWSSFSSNQKFIRVFVILVVFLFVLIGLMAMCE